MSDADPTGRVFLQGFVAATRDDDVPVAVDRQSGRKSRNGPRHDGVLFSRPDRLGARRGCSGLDYGHKLYNSGFMWITCE